MDGDLHVTDDVIVAGHELEWSYSSSGGPGGQHANRSRTKAMVRLDLAASESIPAWARARMIEKLGESVSAVSDDQRSQWQNRRVARERLTERLQDALRRRPPRRATKPTRGSQRRRVEAKRQRSQVKKGRRRPDHSD